MIENVSIKEKSYKAADLRALIGKRIRWLESVDIDRSGRGYLSFRYGTVEAVEGRNALIEGDYRWIPDIRHIEEWPE